MWDILWGFLINKKQRNNQRIYQNLCLHLVCIFIKLLFGIAIHLIIEINGIRSVQDPAPIPGKIDPIQSPANLSRFQS